MTPWDASQGRLCSRDGEDLWLIYRPSCHVVS
jgi:hypothetical protein